MNGNESKQDYLAKAAQAEKSATLTTDIVIRDEEGAEFEYIQAAFVEAEHSARELAIEQIKGGYLGDGAAVELTNAKGAVLMVVPLRLFLARH